MLTGPSRLKRPPRLKAGDSVAVVSPSWGGPGAFPHRYAAGKAELERCFGVNVIEMACALAPPDWVKAHPEARAEDLMAAFANPDIHGIVATIGGDDSVRLIPYLDLAVIRDNPKPLLGFSDTTTLHFACLKAGITSFYGPSIMAGFAENGGMHAYSRNGVEKAMFSADPIGTIAANGEGWTAERLEWGDPALQDQRRTLQPATPPRILQGQGRASGPLIGGCAEVLEMLKGTAWWPEPEVWDGAILFYETSEDAPSPDFVRYWLRNFAACGILGRLNGLLLARPDPGGDPHYMEKLETATTDILAESGLTGLPVLSGLDFGHTQPMLTLPMGALAEIDCDTSTLRILESGVS